MGSYWNGKTALDWAKQGGGGFYSYKGHRDQDKIVEFLENHEKDQQLLLLALQRKAISLLAKNGTLSSDTVCVIANLIQMKVEEAKRSIFFAKYDLQIRLSTL